MKSLQDILKRKIQKIKFKITKTQHLLIKAKSMGSGNFILDTGASNSCVGFESIELFLHSRSVKTKLPGRSYRNVYTNCIK
jgi:hypothetical protein